MVDLETEPVELGGGGIKSAYINGLFPSLSLSLSLCLFDSKYWSNDWLDSVIVLRRIGNISAT